jgi:hypothetical protein
MDSDYAFGIFKLFVIYIVLGYNYLRNNSLLILIKGFYTSSYMIQSQVFVLLLHNTTIV